MIVMPLVKIVKIPQILVYHAKDQNIYINKNVLIHALLDISELKLKAKKYANNALVVVRNVVDPNSIVQNVLQINIYKIKNVCNVAIIALPVEILPRIVQVVQTISYYLIINV